MNLEDAWDFFMFLQQEASQEMFQGVWTESWQHYWEKYAQCKFNIVYFWPRLDPLNKRKLIAYYFLKCDEPKHIVL